MSPPFLNKTEDAKHEDHVTTKLKNKALPIDRQTDYLLIHI